jgi:hypothetical protein
MVIFHNSELLTFWETQAQSQQSPSLTIFPIKVRRGDQVRSLHTLLSLPSQRLYTFYRTQSKTIFIPKLRTSVPPLSFPTELPKSLCSLFAHAALNSHVQPLYIHSDVRQAEQRTSVSRLAYVQNRHPIRHHPESAAAARCLWGPL